MITTETFPEMSADSVWMKQYDLSWSEWLGVKVLRQGRVPRHVAVIMDGNRRFARQVLRGGNKSIIKTKVT